MMRKRQNRQNLTNGERWKRSMEGNMKKYRKDDTLNKKHKWAMLEAKNPTENTERLKQQVFKKNVYKKRACVRVCVCVFISFHRKSFSRLNKTTNVMPEFRSVILC